MLIGYASTKLHKICTESKAAKKALPQTVAERLPQRLGELAAFRCLKDVPIGTPLFRHALSADWSGHYAVRIDKKFRIVFRPLGEFDLLPDETPDLGTVTEIEIVAIEDYHPGS
jgi:plasmid maintenance system killer protein